MEYNFINSNLPASDKELFFGPLTIDATFITLEDRWIMAHALVAAGVFASVSQARKAGWDKPIAKGFTDIRVGKLKTRITILEAF